MGAIFRNNVQSLGQGTQPIMFAHGLGCDQHMWRLVTPAFEDDHRIVLFDHVGAGASDTDAYDAAQYATLERYAEDVLEIIDAMGLQQTVFVGHSVSAMIGILAAIKRPAAFSKLILVGPSPCYINDGDYFGGFNRSDIDALLDFMDENYVAWSRAMAPTIMGNGDRPDLAEELADSFCRTDPTIAKQFARLTFMSDNRADLGKLQVPALILQCSQDPIAPVAVGRYMHSQLAGSSFVQLRAAGHCPHVSAPDETAAAIRAFL
ncbi:alpha/beta fold hydrolase [Massilia sp. TS11]|uniref:alpha/beta fold hydrolase n=1 Tax=Massilia sp. TS11 TaxID=2908003 RepID=UPI001ED9E6BC|nr:alpha/beta hydrolase [Massilia sp. TS11]MCG2582984.1 alpha/beta hydrolase [Massilia sp. TS11]